MKKIIKRILIVLFALILLRFAIRITTSTYENMTRGTALMLWFCR